MNLKILKPNFKKIAIFFGLLIVEFFVLPIKALLIYSPKLGADYTPLTTVCSTFQAVTSNYNLGDCKLIPLSWAYIIPAIIISYILVCILVSKIEFKKK